MDRAQTLSTVMEGCNVVLGKTEVINIHAVAAIFHACSFVSGLSYNKWVASHHDYFINVAFM